MQHFHTWGRAPLAPEASKNAPGGLLGRAQETPQKAVIDQLFASWRPRRAPSEFIFGPEGAQEGLKADPGTTCAATWRARAVPIASEAPPRPQRGHFGHNVGYFWGSNRTFSRVASAIAGLRLEVRRFDGIGLEALGRAKNCQSQSPGERRKQGGGGESPQASSINQGNLTALRPSEGHLNAIYRI